MYLLPQQDYDPISNKIAVISNTGSIFLTLINKMYNTLKKELKISIEFTFGFCASMTWVFLVTFRHLIEYRFDYDFLKYIYPNPISTINETKNNS